MALASAAGQSRALLPVLRLPIDDSFVFVLVFVTSRVETFTLLLLPDRGDRDRRGHALRRVCLTERVLSGYACFGEYAFDVRGYAGTRFRYAVFNRLEVANFTIVTHYGCWIVVHCVMHYPARRTNVYDSSG